MTTNLSILFLFLLLKASLATDPCFLACRSPKTCGDNQNISYPFYIENKQDPICGLPGFKLTCDNNGLPTLNLSGNFYLIHHINYKNQTLRLSNAAISSTSSANTKTRNCIPLLQNISLPDDRFQLAENQTDLYLFYNCNASLVVRHPRGCFGDSENGSVVGLMGRDPKLRNVARECGNMVVAPVDKDDHDQNEDEELGEVLRRGFLMKWLASDCTFCENSGGRCGFDYKTLHFKCYCPDRPHAWHCVNSEKKTFPWKLLLSLGIGFLAVVLCLFFAIWQFKRHGVLNLRSRNIPSELSHSKSDLEGGSVLFGVPVFSYCELDEATNSFDPAKELGDGGFGAVYHGKLRDGREVAVKRLYEHNYRRLEQFMNEVKILTSLRHKNLVSLYGCTSRRSRELLLVYEFISNGTLADHLHGDRANPSLLTWPIRMSIAIEIASALVYLHASNIIHRDVKTTNILLDNNFCVKVADFGLSRYFPDHVTHVSTAPQGTPGYVDPEYHQFYQLTSKSDVYSFGVVLIELVSSMPAVDITRHRHEINLSHLAINKIQKCAFSELIDPNLGFESDNEVRSMTIEVAQLAFRCLQGDKETRPTMVEVFKALQRIQRENNVPENREAADNNSGVLTGVEPSTSVECHDVELLRNIRQPFSPNSVADKWLSTSTSSNISGTG